MKIKKLKIFSLAKKQEGFTMIELLIVLAIVVVLTTITLASLTRSQEQQVFSNSFDRIYSMINNARSLAIAGKGQMDFVDFDNDGCKNVGPAGASCTVPDYVTPANYGVYFNNTVGAVKNVTVFADMNLPTSGTPTGSKDVYNAGTSYATGDDLDLDNLALPSGLTMELQYDDSGILADGSSGSVFYSPNYADPSFQAFVPNPYLVIRLKSDSNATICKQIRIHKLAGIPEVEPCGNY